MSIGARMGTSPFDAVDRAILYQLQENGRKSITDVASAVGVSDNTVRNRIQALEERDVIQGFQVNVNYDKVAVQHYYVFLCTARVSERETLAEKVREFDGVLEVITLMTGQQNVIVLAAGSEKDDMTDLASKLDESGIRIEREHLVREHFRKAFDGFRRENNEY